jgi:hypothetical protein
MYPKPLLLLLLMAWMGSSQAQLAEDSPFHLYSTLIEDFFAMTKEAGARWQETVDRLDHEQVLVLKALNKQADYQHHASLLKQYQQATADYQQFLSDLRIHAKQRLQGHELTDAQLEPVLNNLMNNYQAQRSVLLALLQTHLDYASNMQRFLAFLEQHQDSWHLEAGQIKMADQSLGQEYNQMIDQMMKQEDRIEQLMKNLQPDHT